MQDDARQEAVLPPQDRVLAVRPFWETVAQEERVKLLSLSLEELRARAEELTQRAIKEQGALNGCADNALLSLSGCRRWFASMESCDKAGDGVALKWEGLLVIHNECCWRRCVVSPAQERQGEAVPREGKYTKLGLHTLLWYVRYLLTQA